MDMNNVVVTAVEMEVEEGIQVINGKGKYKKLCIPFNILTMLPSQG